MVTTILLQICKHYFLRIVQESTSKQEVAIKLGYKFYNGKISKKISLILQEYNISTNHFDLYIKNRKFSIVEKNCPICNKLFNTKQGSSKEKTTCSVACSNSFFIDSRYSKESNEKRSQSLIDHFKINPQPHLITNCFICGKEFKTSKWRQKRKHSHCSKDCLLKNSEYRKKTF